MVKREIVLLIGNGFNRTINDDYYSSENLLIHLAKNKKDFNCKEIIKKASFPLCFESIACSEPSEKINDLFDKIRNYLKRLDKTDNDIIRYIDLSKCKNIITTNYDYAIEFNLFKDKIKENKIRNNGGRKTVFGDTTIFHIHGTTGHEKSQNICLGTIGYNKYLRSLQSGMPSTFKAIVDNYDKYISKLPGWAKLMLTDDVHIIGLNLSVSEKDLWYLLTLRAYLISAGLPIKNKIEYHDIVLQKEEITVLKQFYKGLSIEYKGRVLDMKQKYKSEYIFILNEIFNQ